MIENQSSITILKEKLNREWAHKYGRYLSFILLISLFYFPIIKLYTNSVSFILLGSESIAYRYFYVYRMINGEVNPSLWLPQGFLTTSIQKLVFILEELAISPQSQLRLSIEVFGYLTFFAHSLVALFLIFFVIWDKNLINTQRALIILGLFLPIYGTGFYGFYYTVLPDYLSLDIILYASFIYYFYLFSMRNDQEISTKLIAGVAFLSGISVSNKISIIFVASALVVLLGVRFAKQPLFLLRILLISIPVFILGMLLPWLISHYPNYGIFNIGEYLKLWLNFITNAPQEGSFNENIKVLIRDHPQYIQLVSIHAVLLIFLLIYILQRYTVRSQQFATASGLLIIAFLQLFVVLRTRFSGTTSFEAVTALTSFTLMLVGFVTIEENWMIWIRRSFIAICFVIILTGLDFDSTISYGYVGRRIQDANLLMDIHEQALSYNRPIIVVVPDNSFIVQMGMEELFLKGFSDFPTWNITAGRNLMDELVPSLSYRSDYIEQKPEMPYPTNVVIIWFDKAESVSEKVTDLRETYSELHKVLLINGTECHQWFLENRARIVNICAVP